MSRARIDLFDDPPWTNELPSHRVRGVSPRALLIASSGCIGAFLISMGQPWFASGETPQWTPFSHWLDRGFFPGTQKWGFLMLALGVVAALVVIIGLFWPRLHWQIAFFVLATVLVVVTVSEAAAHLSVNPGPNLGADYGAWIGVAAVVLAWCSAAVAVALRHSRRPVRRECRPEHVHG